MSQENRGEVSDAGEMLTKLVEGIEGKEHCQPAEERSGRIAYVLNSPTSL